MDIPLEILFIILRNFRGDPRTLKTLALVSRPFLLIARGFLFARIKLATLNPHFSRHASRLARLFSHEPALCYSIRELELGPAVLRMSSDPVSAFHTSHWAAVHGQRLPSIHDYRVQFIMENAVNVRSLTLRFEYQDWHNLSPAFQDSVTRLVTRDSIVTLRIEDVINFPLHIISKSRSIRHLSLGFVAQHPAPLTRAAWDQNNWTTQSHGSTHRVTSLKNTGTHYPSKLASLTLFESDDCVPALLQHLDLTKLRRLSVNATGFDGRAALKEITEVAQHLDTLEVRLSNQRLATLLLPTLPTVKTLFLNLSFPFQSTFEDIHTLLLPAPSSRPPPLASLTNLRISFRTSADQEMWAFMLSPMMDSAWSLLDPEYHPYPSLEQTTWVVSPRQVDVLKKAEDHIIDRLLDTPWSKMLGRVIEVAEDRFETYCPACL